ncbi:MAG: amino acid permease, partial [Candidatus Diapherotrites archaeon]|nr:amino acid permease [Candidatus Diapherotrites archaeon]
VLGVIALFATSNTVLMMMTATSRLVYGMAENCGPIKGFSHVLKKRGTPWVAIIFIALLTGAFTLFEHIEEIASMTNFFVFATFFIVNASVIWLRFKQPKKKRLFKVPFNIGKVPVLSVIGALVCVLMLNYLRITEITVTATIIITGILIAIWLDKKTCEPEKAPVF